MFQLFKEVRFDWLGWRRLFIGLSILLMLAGLGSAVFRQWKHPNGTDPFNLGVDFKGGTVVTTRFKQPTTAEAIRETLSKQGVKEAVIQPVTDKTDTFLIKIPLEGSGGESRRRWRLVLDIHFGRTTGNDLARARPWGHRRSRVGIAGADHRHDALAHRRHVAGFSRDRFRHQISTVDGSNQFAPHVNILVDVDLLRLGRFFLLLLWNRNGGDQGDQVESLLVNIGRGQHDSRNPAGDDEHKVNGQRNKNE